MSLKNLQLSKVYHKGVVNKEYLCIQVMGNCELNKYLVYDDTFKSDGTLSNENRHIFRFPKINVNKGDLIKLYTHVGKYIPNKQEMGITHHFLYMNLDSKTIWNKSKDIAHLIFIDGEENKNV